MTSTDVDYSRGAKILAHVKRKSVIGHVYVLIVTENQISWTILAQQRAAVRFSKYTEYEQSKFSHGIKNSTEHYTLPSKTSCLKNVPFYVCHILHQPSVKDNDIDDTHLTYGKVLDEIIEHSRRRQPHLDVDIITDYIFPIIPDMDFYKRYLK